MDNVFPMISSPTAQKDSSPIQDKIPLKDNPLLTLQKLKIIDEARPKHSLQALLGLDSNRFLEFKKTEKWVVKH